MEIIQLSSVTAGRHFEEELNIIQTNIILYGEGKKVIAIVPTTKEKNVFPLAASLAESFAKGQRSVLLIDVSREGEALLGLSEGQNENGLFDILANDLAAFSFVLETDIGGLYYLATGTDTVNTRELLGGIPFESLISGIKEQYDYVFLLMPALNQSLESTIIARVVDGSILVATSGTSYDKISRPIEMLKKGSPIIGSILLKKKTSLLPPFAGKKGKR